jgi:hypothetical protein
MAWRDYDCFPFRWETPDGKFQRMELRHYDAGSDGGKGEYQRWQLNSGSLISNGLRKCYDEVWYERTLTQDGWDHWYGELSEAVKLEFERERTARLALKARGGGASAEWTAHTQIVHGVQ